MEVDSKLSTISRIRLVSNCRSGMRKFYRSSIFENSTIMINELVKVATSESHIEYLRQYSKDRYYTNIKLLSNIDKCNKMFGEEGRYNDKVDISSSTTYLGGKYVTTKIYSPLIGDTILLLTPLGSGTSDSVRGALILMAYLKISFLEDMLDRTPMSLYEITYHCSDNNSKESRSYKDISLFHIVRALNFARLECSIEELNCVVLAVKYSSPYIYSFLGLKDKMKYMDINSAIHDKYYELLNMTNNYYQRYVNH